MFKSSRQQQRFMLLIAFIVIAYAASFYDSSKATQTTHSSLQSLYDQKLSDIQVDASGVVIKILADDNEGTRHQKFIVKESSGLTILVAHNIDLAPRVKNLRQGDDIRLFGEYEWSQKGGVVHWTHHDPNGHHVGGWIEYLGERYQ